MENECNVRNIIKKYLYNNFDHDISINDDLQETGMDSISFVKIIIEIENTFGISFSPDDLLPSSLNTIRKICEKIETYKK